MKRERKDLRATVAGGVFIGRGEETKRRRRNSGLRDMFRNGRVERSKRL